MGRGGRQSAAGCRRPYRRRAARLQDATGIARQPANEHHVGHRLDRRRDDPRAPQPVRRPDVDGPNMFPIVVVFGALGWLGIKVDIGIMMTASVALGVAVDDTIHFVWWFRHGIREGMDRRAATLYAYERCGTAMTQTTIIAGLGLAVFATSTFTRRSSSAT